jgi:L-alanine-DL-glutamate epimerase-like enolase superfamily enzyme
MKLSFAKYNLMLKHTFTVSSYSRKYTPVIIVKIVHKDITGYGEASLPQYLGETQATTI